MHNTASLNSQVPTAERELKLFLLIVIITPVLKLDTVWMWNMSVWTY